METKTYWWDEIADELVWVTNPKALVGDDWEATGRRTGAAEEWRDSRGHEGWLISAYTREEAEASLRLVMAP